RLEDLLLLLAHVARDGVALGCRQLDLVLMRHHERGDEELLEKRRRPHRVTAELLRARRKGEAECKRDGGATRGVGHARVLAPPSRRLDGSLSSRHPRPPSVQPTDGVASTTSRSESSASLRSEEHTSELQSPDHLVCRLLLEK